MALPLEDYALIGDTQTAALVGRDGSIDWLCLPRFDSGACFAALLGDQSHGRWRVAPAGAVRAVRRRYAPGTLVLETEFETAEGTVRVTDFMPPRASAPDIVRIVEGLRGRVPMHMELTLRFDYGSIVPWVRSHDRRRLAPSPGPTRCVLRTRSRTRGERPDAPSAEFTVAEGERVPFMLTWFPSHERSAALAWSAVTRPGARPSAWWREWSAAAPTTATWREPCVRSLITLKALTYAPTGGIVAAPTTSLPEQLGGVRNWDYRYCWLRDATFTLLRAAARGLHRRGRARGATGCCAPSPASPTSCRSCTAWRASAGSTEFELAWLPGYEGSHAGAHRQRGRAQFQLDVYGEVIDALHQAAQARPRDRGDGWELEQALLDVPRGDLAASRTRASGRCAAPRRHFTHSKVMAWVAFDRAVKARRAVRPARARSSAGARCATRSTREVCAQGFDAERRRFTQFYGSTRARRQPADDPAGRLPAAGRPARARHRRGDRARAAARRLRAALPTRRTDVDGLPPGEGAFLACTFWLADNLRAASAAATRRARCSSACSALRNDVGLLAEEYDVDPTRLVGNFPQAFSHVALINTAQNLSREGGPGHERLRHWHAQASRPTARPAPALGPPVPCR